jgi:hypothetical protein
MFEKLIFLLLKAKVAGFAGLQAPLIAALVVLSMTGFVVTGTISHGEDGEDEVNLIVKPLETRTCVEALIAQTETLSELEALAADSTQQLRRLRERARAQAEEQRKMLDEAPLRVQFDTSSSAIRDELSRARQPVYGAVDLGKCQDGDPNTTIVLDIAGLGRTYDGIVRDFGKTLNDFLDGAQDAFDQFVAKAPQRPAPKASDSKDGGGDHARR